MAVLFPPTMSSNVGNDKVPFDPALQPNHPLVPPNVPLVMIGGVAQPANGWIAKHPKVLQGTTISGALSSEPASADLGRVTPKVTLPRDYSNPYTRNDPDAWMHPPKQTPSGPVLEEGDLLFNAGMAATPRAASQPPQSPTGIGSGSSAPVMTAIQTASKASGLTNQFLTAVAHIESGGDASAHDPGSQYKGLYQLGDGEMAANGGGDPYNATDNANAAAKNFGKLAGQFQSKYGRAPTSGELYLMHQQGAAGAFAHIDNPNGIAWQNVRKYFKSDAIAKSAIWGNVPTDVRKQFPGGVDTMTSADFMTVWNSKIAKFGGGDSPFTQSGP